MALKTDTLLSLPRFFYTTRAPCRSHSGRCLLVVITSHRSVRVSGQTRRRELAFPSATINNTNDRFLSLSEQMGTIPIIRVTMDDNDTRTATVWQTNTTLTTKKVWLLLLLFMFLLVCAGGHCSCSEKTFAQVATGKLIMNQVNKTRREKWWDAESNSNNYEWTHESTTTTVRDNGDTEDSWDQRPIDTSDQQRRTIYNVWLSVQKLSYFLWSSFGPNPSLPSACTLRTNNIS